jgi:Ala-tRNA(Pro) deacylase
MALGEDGGPQGRPAEPGREVAGSPPPPGHHVTAVLDEAGVGYELLPHAHTETAADEAEALGVPPGEVAKTLVVTTPSGHVRAVVPASERLDLGKLRDVLAEGGRHKVHLAAEEDLGRDYGDFELGAVPPFGGPDDDVVVDRRVAARESVVVEAGNHDQSLRLAAADLVRITGAQVADICED